MVESKQEIRRSMIASERARFGIPREVSYLNCAYMSPFPREVQDAGVQGIQGRSSPWDLGPECFFEDSEEVRRLSAELISARPEDMAIVPSVSYGIAIAARNLPIQPGQDVLVLEEQFPSNVYAWQEAARRQGGGVRTVLHREDGDWTRAVLEAIDEHVGVAALPGCHWADGGQLDLPKVAAALRTRGIPLVLDLTQSLGVVPFDVNEVRPDYMVAAGYKWLLGPQGAALMYVAPSRQDGVPIEYNWIARAGSEDFSRLVYYQSEFQPGARRFDMGERSNTVLLPMVKAALRLILEWGPEAIQSTLKRMTTTLTTELEQLGFVSSSSLFCAPHYVSVAHPGKSLERLSQALVKERVYISIRGARLRITPYLYNDDEDIERLVDVVRRVP
jgi:selenocysteine lyase/cysteine desulfurase